MAKKKQAPAPVLPGITNPESGAVLTDPRAFRDMYYGTPDAERAARAIRAARKFNSMLPMFNAMARAMTKNPATKVLMATGTPCTDGTVIYLRPHISMGDELKHSDRHLCGVRDSVSHRQLCAACCSQESVMTDLYHEMAHIIGGSFAKIDERDAVLVIKQACEERKTEQGTTRGDKIAAKIAEYENHSYGPMTYVTASKLVSPFMGVILNAWEDAYVNRKLFDARPGVKPMFDATEYEIFEQGMETPDGTVRTWADMPVDAQAIIGLFCKASGYDYRGWFDPSVEAFLDTPEVSILVYQFTTCRSPKARYRLGFPTLDLLRANGFCKQADDPEDDPEPQPEPIGQEPCPDGANQEKREGEKSESDQPGKGEPDESDDAAEPADSPEGQPGDTDQPRGDAPTGSVLDDYHQDDSDDDDDYELSDDEKDGALPADAGDSDDSDDETDSDDSESDASDADDPDDGESDDDDADDSDDSESDGGEQESDSQGGGSAPDNSGDPFDDLLADNEPGAGDQPGYSDPTEVEEALATFGGHGPPNLTQSDKIDQQEVDRAIVQSEFFDTPSSKVFGIDIHRYDKHVIMHDGVDKTTRFRRGPWSGTEGGSDRRGGDGPWEVDPSVLSPALLKMRSAFADNRSAKKQLHLKTGRITQRTLAIKFATGDERLFQKRKHPGKRDYFVVIGMDISGSTIGMEIKRIKRATLAMSELLNRLGVSFAVYGHSGGMSAVCENAASVDIVCIKEPHEPWSDKTRTRLTEVGAFGSNIDGQTVEFYRKVMDRQQATDKMLMFFTDGQLNLAVGDEQHDIILRELKIMDRQQYTMVGIEVNTESHMQDVGIDTVTCNSDQDIIKLVDELKIRIVKKLREVA
jgi:hypothetical protein